MTTPEPRVRVDDSHLDEWPPIYDQRSGARIRRLPAHGTYAGANRHTKIGEKRCDDCRAAATAYTAELRRKRRAAGGNPTAADRLARLLRELEMLGAKWLDTAYRSYSADLSLGYTMAAADLTAIIDRAGGTGC